MKHSLNISSVEFDDETEEIVLTYNKNNVLIDVPDNIQGTFYIQTVPVQVILKMQATEFNRNVKDGASNDNPIGISATRRGLGQEDMMVRWECVDDVWVMKGECDHNGNLIAQ